MSLLESGPADAVQAQSLIAQALEQMQAKHWDESMQLLESAIVAAPPEIQEPALEVLASIYVSRNQHARLRNLMCLADPSTPQMIKAGLLLARNHAIGIEGELPAHCDERSLGPALRAHVVAGAYQLASELPVILALLAQLGWAELAWQIAMLCAAARIGVDGGVIDRVLAVLLSAGMRAQALELVQELRSLPESEARPIRRWLRLLGIDPLEAVAGDSSTQDKVERFLQCAQVRRAA
jgi:hypothetical protein